MSLLNVICEVLEYFGISSDILLSLWQRKPYGQSRSIVRRIGSALPLNHWPRICFQLLERLNIPDFRTYTPEPTVPSLADAAWIADDEGDTFIRFRNEVRTAKVQCMISSVQEHYQSTTSVNHLKRKNNTLYHGVSNENALNKISQLEDELSRLRSQIAMIISGQDQGQGSDCLRQLKSNGLESNGFSVPGTPAFVPPPKLASTPLGALSNPSVAATEQALPPPPPPPPPPPLTTEKNVAASKDLKQDCQALKIRSRDATIKPMLTKKPSNSFNMMNVLKDMQNVKLRVVERSPGGTPVGKKPARKPHISDPAALIAEALKQKFAHRYLNDSSDKENESFEFSPLSSPETSRFGRHIQRHDNQNTVKNGKIVQPGM
ncbi:mitochondrial fission regulator 2 [Hemitrygon akajei]|uniref:mitochondrial fission regulator 2 n=1 Tax=Hemitrygon akajei TaxID=2704970 RepID=UPI003BF9F3BC